MPRADAQRNRARILMSAKKAFAERGPDAPLDEIARNAGVGNATLYRHFPTRRDLLIAVYADEVTELTANGRDLLHHDPPADALFAWLRAFIAHAADKGDLARAIPEDGRSPLFDEWHAAMHATVAPLLARAQEAGAVRSDLDGPDLLALAGAIAAAGSGTARTDRLLRLVREGIATSVPAPD
ncbi:TetR family transcriptional regulator [Actinomadura sp. LD22]|uniref:TetR family transcriptional regulator n=1 Tax=Actinomadura physcomitrii TaxID=2650748 RepID=A0A6I4MC60_9ACTN|nr:TetR/AcrR family transcriptional regulator [Actinomadura physcomitrii]MWA02025.1 TetR family transcriptional regulator [Actinomadura physcomitrii]